MATKTRRRFTAEFKREAVKLAGQPGRTVTAVARELGIERSVLKRWVENFAAGKYEKDEKLPPKSAQQQENEQLRGELMKVKMERDILSAGLLRERADVKFAFIARYRQAWPTRVMCRLLGVSASGFYEWLERPQSARALANARLLVRIRESFALSEKTYGSPRVWKDLVVAGEGCGQNRVARLMRLANLRANPEPRRKPRDGSISPEPGIAANLLERDFNAQGPNRKWAADFTYIWTGEGWLFLAVVVDLFSRRVVGWSMQANMSAQLVLDALIMALWRRGKPAELLHHSDQGSQYTSEDFQRLLAAEGITCSMSRRGDCWDNSVVKSFFASLKKERVHRARPTPRAMRHGLMFSTTSRRSTTSGGDVRRWDRSALPSSKRLNWA